MTTEKLYVIELSKREADGYLHAIERVTQVWLSGKARDRHLKQRHVHSHNAIRKLMEELKKIVYADLGLPQESGTAFDRELARENEEEAQALGGVFEPPAEGNDDD